MCTSRFFVWSCTPRAVPSGQAVGRTTEVRHNNAVAEMDKMLHDVAVALPIRSLPSTFTSTLNLHLYPQPPPLPSNPTSSLNLPFYPPPPLLPPTSTSVLHLHLHPRPPKHHVTHVGFLGSIIMLTFYMMTAATMIMVTTMITINMSITMITTINNSLNNACV